MHYSFREHATGNTTHITMNANIYCETAKSYLEKTMEGYDPLTFLREYPEPRAAFRGPVSYLFRQHVRVYLLNRFPAMDSHFVLNIIDESGPRLEKAYRTLATIDLEDHSLTPRCLRPQQPMPAEVDQAFYDELVYVLHRDEIEAVAVAVKSTRQDRYAAAKHQLVDCACCCDDCLPEDQLLCPSGHAFCPNCVQKGAEMALGQGKAQLTCLAHACPHVYEPSALQEALKPSTLRALQCRARSHAAPQAEHVESCPYCHLPCDMAEITGHTFLCPNPDCARTSCRLCGGPSHPNKPCHTSDAPDVAAYVTAAISEAVLRICGQCQSRVVKEVGGCNHITCSCGAEFCYVCRQTIRGYAHFRESKGCVLYKDEELQQQHEVRMATERALRQYCKKFPLAPMPDIHAFLQRLGGDVWNDHRFFMEASEKTTEANDESPDTDATPVTDATPAARRRRQLRRRRKKQR